MVITIPEIIAAVCPERYLDSGEDNDFAHKQKVKRFKAIIDKHLKEAEGKAKKEDKKEETEKRNGLALVAGIKEAQGEGLSKGKAEATHVLKYDSPTETLEPIYFFILDLINDFGFKTEKLVDNFVSSPGSGHFGEMGQRSSIMQQQGSKLLADINMVIRSILNVVYDLRDFATRLESYNDYRGKDKEKVESALLSLKQVWMDKVDINKGNSSLKAMGLGQAGFTTLLDAFLVCDNEAEVDKLDLNATVKRILKPRIAEFNHWIKYSESELRKRYEIEKTYLKSQVNSMHLYIGWAKPYLRAAQQLQMSENDRHPALVKMFNTMLLELSLIAKREFKAGDFKYAETGVQDIPASWGYKPKKKYFEVVFVDFDFRGIPQRTQQGFVAGGKTAISFKAYALDENQLKLFDLAFKSTNLTDAFDFVEGATTESMEQLTKDINFFLYDEETEEEVKAKETKKKSTGTNPFLALFGAYNSGAGEKKPAKKSGGSNWTKRDKEAENKYIIPALQWNVKNDTFTFFEIYKKVHGMPAFP
ncbi:MAG: hypothetical protein PF542_06345 [Nanoarchaeota archaeon]|nr:hypothetical protein [Nanoarchaeota archaeon]